MIYLLQRYKNKKVPPPAIKQNGGTMRYCKLKTCEDKHFGVGFCVVHYRKYHRFGDPLFSTKYDPRPAIIKEDHALIPVGLNAKFGYAMVDKEDAWIDKYKWTSSKGYATNRTGLSIHRLVMGEPKGMAVDHIDGNILDNRKNNLRICTLAENSRNFKLSKANKSGYRGVSWRKTHNAWSVAIRFDGKVYWLGLFKDKINAAKAYNKAAKEKFGEFARLNEV